MVSLSAVKGSGFTRSVIALACSKGSPMLAAGFAKNRWRDTPAVAEYLIKMAAVAGGDPSVVGWASELSPFGFAEDFIACVRARTVIDRLPGKRRAPFRTNVPVETSGVGGAWLAPGAGIPAAAAAFDTLALDAFSAGVIVVLTGDLLRLIAPASEENIRQSLVAGVAEFIDTQFLDPSITAIAHTRPASITNGAQQISSTGSTAALITADLSNMLDAVDDLISPAWIMNAKTCANLALTLGQPDIKIINGFLLGFPIICTKSSPAPVGSPAVPRLLTLVDANAVVLADDGGADITVSTQATIEQSTAPTGDAAAGTAMTQNMVSLFQSGAAAARITRRIAWKRVRATAVAFMEVSY